MLCLVSDHHRVVSYLYDSYRHVSSCYYYGDRNPIREHWSCRDCTDAKAKKLLRMGYNDRIPNYLEKIVARKKIEVETLLRQHQELDDPLVMRM